jgi:hypothetical protein
MDDLQQSLSSKKKILRWFITRGSVSFVVGLIVFLWTLPSLLNGANRAKEMEAQTMVRTIANAQASYFLSEQSFTNNVSNLDIISRNLLKQNKLGTSTYNYSISRPNNFIVQINAWSKKIEQWPRINIRNYIGFVWSEQKTTYIKICTQVQALPVVPDSYYFPIGMSPSCPEDYQELK